MINDVKHKDFFLLHLVAIQGFVQLVVRNRILVGIPCLYPQAHADEKSQVYVGHQRKHAFDGSIFLHQEEDGVQKGHRKKQIYKRKVHCLLKSVSSIHEIHSEDFSFIALDESRKSKTTATRRMLPFLQDSGHCFLGIIQVTVECCEVYLEYHCDEKLKDDFSQISRFHRLLPYFKLDDMCLISFIQIKHLFDHYRKQFLS